ncbi:unnamed protein product [Adineta steineri]|uniref:Uncharacterized protein n=1 Tax=Adineta steineri TaxID=433720 RepID=A0A819KIB3_9BILA|nr:unnamed protein product [Adineta steineri]CAF3947869.1 unnamed protein product [Adineta steineri]CAF4134645.1 unnamed protein product [Adineta steineri]
METHEYLYSGSTWFNDRLHGADGKYWRKARKCFLFKNNLSSALNLFKFDYKAIQIISRPEGTILKGTGKTTLDPDEKREHRPGQAWADDAKNSIRTLLDRIVTRWVPKYLYLSKINIRKLHDSLTPEPLQDVKETYDETNNDIDSFNVDKALELYQGCLVPLYYHELWSEIMKDFINVETTLKERETVINVSLFYEKETLDETEESALIFGTNRVTYNDSYKPLSKKPGIFDLVLIKVKNVEYFGMIVHVEQNKVKVADEGSCQENNNADNGEHNNLKIELNTTIGVYVSRACSVAFQQYRNQTKDDKLAITKLTNISSTRRMISAIHSLSEWPQYRSILKPMINDIYFQEPEDYDPRSIIPTSGFNMAQSKTITIAECMFNDLQERMRIVHGPPGTGKSRTIAGIVSNLLLKVSDKKRKKKILLCAPSNNACDELSRRIIDEFKKKGIPHKDGTIVRIGCQPPDDYHLCDYFLDFMILQDIVNVLKTDQRISPNIAEETEGRLMRHAQIIISTLNYCGSTRMQSLKSSTGFIIIDEASQGSEADLLLPLRFKCTKLMLVGDPQQLPPCVLSDAGKTYGLSQSLYGRLFSIFDQYPDGPISMLNIQYRMHPDICRFPSGYFYSNRLITHDSVERRMRHFTLKPLYLYNITNSPHSYDSAKSSYNQGEAKCIQAFCSLLIAHLAEQSPSIFGNSNSDERSTDNSDDDNDEDDDDDDNDESSTTCSSVSTSRTTNDSINEVENETRCLQRLSINDPRLPDIQQHIAIITPYKAQVRLFRSYLPPYIEVMTADSSQGKEKDIVILSCVRSGDTIGFLNDMNRMNVMLTRSKYALYVFGNLTQLADQDDAWKAFVKHAHTNKIICDTNIPPLNLPYR